MAEPTLFSRDMGDPGTWAPRSGIAKALWESMFLMDYGILYPPPRGVVLVTKCVRRQGGISSSAYEVAPSARILPAVLHVAGGVPSRIRRPENSEERVFDPLPYENRCSPCNIYDSVIYSKSRF